MNIHFLELGSERFNNAIHADDYKSALTEITNIVDMQVNTGPSFNDRLALQKVQQVIARCKAKTSGPIVRHVPADDTEGGAI